MREFRKKPQGKVLNPVGPGSMVVRLNPVEMDDRKQAVGRMVTECRDLVKNPEVEEQRLTPNSSAEKICVLLALMRLEGSLEGEYRTQLMFLGDKPGGGSKGDYGGRSKSGGGS